MHSLFSLLLSHFNKGTSLTSLRNSKNADSCKQIDKSLIDSVNKKATSENYFLLNNAQIEFQI